ncbi:MAG: WYL domain-containing protein, partial [Planctomycetales bacterium]|nr:WYL domain-containing protein [Planctomycetales bacterium]
KAEREPDGSVVITLPAAHDLEIIPRVLALGPEAELLAPAASRRTLAEMAGAVAAKYQA